jgi:hypothetical protein
MATTSNVGQFLEAALTAVENDALKDILPAVASFLNSVVANSSALNIAAQFSLLQVALLAALPTFGQDVAKDIAALLQAQIAKLVPAKA